jgi:hypothetical protein
MRKISFTFRTHSEAQSRADGIGCGAPERRALQPALPENLEDARIERVAKVVTQRRLVCFILESLVQTFVLATLILRMIPPEVACAARFPIVASTSRYQSGARL